MNDRPDYLLSIVAPRRGQYSGGGGGAGLQYTYRPCLAAIQMSSAKLVVDQWGLRWSMLKRSNASRLAGLDSTTEGTRSRSMCCVVDLSALKPHSTESVS